MGIQYRESSCVQVQECTGRFAVDINDDEDKLLPFPKLKNLNLRLKLKPLYKDENIKLYVKSSISYKSARRLETARNQKESSERPSMDISANNIGGGWGAAGGGGLRSESFTLHPHRLNLNLSRLRRK
jgi:hypothetical protein